MCEKIDFDSEFKLQHLTNNRLKVLFGLNYIAHEYTFPGLTVDSLRYDKKTNYLQVDGLAYDEKTNSFVVLEYKNKGDKNVLSQGRDYYYNLLQTDENELINWIKDKLDEEEKEKVEKDKKYYREMLQKNRDNLIERYNKKFDKNLKETDFDFEKAKVMIIGPKFYKSQIEKSEEYNMELYKVSLYRRDEIMGYVSYEGINEASKKRINEASKKGINEVSKNGIKEINVNLGNLKLSRYTLLYNKTDEMRKLYKNLESDLLNQYNDLDVIYFIDLVSIRVQKTKICLVKFGKSIKIEFNDGDTMKLDQDNLEDVIDKIGEIYKENKNDIQNMPDMRYKK